MRNDEPDICPECKRQFWKWGNQMTCSSKCSGDRLRAKRRVYSQNKYKRDKEARLHEAET